MKKSKILVVAMVVALSLSAGSTAMAAEGWTQNSTGWQYENANGGYTADGWQKINGAWYYFNNSAYMHAGWLKQGDTWYYLHTSGAMATGWLKEGNTWYYLRSDGGMQTGWIQDGDNWYYLHSDGAMAFSTTIDGYLLDASGKWIQNDISSGNTGNDTSNEDSTQLAIGYNNTRTWEEIDSLAIEFYEEYYDEIVEMVNLTNERREKLGLSKLELDETMSIAATARAIHMESFGYGDHYYEGVNQAEFVAKRYGFNWTAENYLGTYSSDSPKNIIDSWIASSVHYKNITSTSSKKIGIGYVPTLNTRKEITGIIAIQLFGK